jgi:hypothetical protein
MDDVAVLDQIPATKTPRVRINYALATLLASEGQSMDQIAPQVGAKNANSLQVGMSKRGVTKGKVTKAVAKNSSPDVTQHIALRVVSQASESLRQKFAGILDKTANAIGDIPVIADTKSVKELGEATEPWVRIAKTIHDWGNDAKPGLVRASRYVEIESTCVPEPTTESVPQKALEAPTPQDAQVIDTTTPTE